MKCLTILLVFLAACGGGPAYRANGQLTGAVTARRAVEDFLAAARAQDLQAMSVVWGTSEGPARDVVPRDQLEKRELIMQCYLSHDKFTIMNDAPGQNGKRVFEVSLSKGSLTRQTTFTAVRGPSDRWYVENFQPEPVRDLCASP